jgi:hypothetical protein
MNQMSRILDVASLELLRMIFDLAEADVRPTMDLLGRLLDHDVNRVIALIAGLRRTGLVQHQTLGLTLGGLAIAASLPSTELRPMRVTVPTVRLRIAS